MKIIVSGQDQEIDAKELTIIAYAKHPAQPWSGLNGDTAVMFTEAEDGTVTVRVQAKAAGPGGLVRQVMQYTIHPWEA